MTTEREALHRAITAAGGVTALAKAIGVTLSCVTNWRLRGRVPSEQVIPIVRAVEERVTAHELRPDLYPVASWTLLDKAA